MSRLVFRPILLDMARRVVGRELEQHFASWGSRPGIERSAAERTAADSGVPRRSGTFAFLSISTPAWRAGRGSASRFGKCHTRGPACSAVTDRSGLAKVFHREQHVLPLTPSPAAQLHATLLRRVPRTARGPWSCRAQAGSRDCALRTAPHARRPGLARVEGCSRPRSTAGALAIATAPRPPAYGRDTRLAGEPAPPIGAAPALLRGPVELRPDRRSEEPASRRPGRLETAARSTWSRAEAGTSSPARRCGRYPVHTHGRPLGPLTIAWVVPPWGVGSGGHMTIFRLIRRPSNARARLCRLRLRPLRHGGAARACSCATNTARVRSHPSARVRRPRTVSLRRHRRRDQLVDGLPGEPPTSPASRRPTSSRTTSRGFIPCPRSPRGRGTHPTWISAASCSRRGSPTSSEPSAASRRSTFTYGTDTETYTFGPFDEREPGLVVLYARRETPRRAVELALAALKIAVERRPETRVVLFGSGTRSDVPFPCEDVGVLRPRDLARLYRSANVGVALSMTNLSLVSLEMLASGLPLVELDGENVRSVLGESRELAVLADPYLDAVADAVLELLDDPAGAERQPPAPGERSSRDGAGAGQDGSSRHFHAFFQTPSASSVTKVGSPRPWDELPALPFLGKSILMVRNVLTGR